MLKILKFAYWEKDIAKLKHISHGTRKQAFMNKNGWQVPTK